MTDQVCCSLGFVYLPKEESPKMDFITCDPVPDWCWPCVPKPQEFTQIPLYRRHLKAQFREADLVITERQDYLHRFNDEVEAEFRFPAKMVSLFEFQYQIDDDDWVNMKVEEKRKAEREYQQAINQGHQAVLAKQDNDKIYTVKIGRLKPNQKISLRFSYYSTYEITSESLSYTFPLTAMPPYVRPGDSSEGLPKWHTPSAWKADKNLPYGITLDASFERSAPFSLNFISDQVTTFQSTENTLKVPRQTLDGKTNVTFQVKPTEGFGSKAFQWTSPEGQKYVQVCLANYFKSADQVPLPTADNFSPEKDGDWEVVDPDSESTHVQRRVLFIGDGSGSMGGDPIKDLKNAMELALKDQPRSAKFSMAMFGSSFKFYPEAKRLTSIDTRVRQKPTTTMVNGQVIHAGFACDGCQMMPVVGDRHKCQECPDFDLCSGCFKRNSMTPFHTSSHVFQTVTGKQEDPLTSESSSVAPTETEDAFWLEQTDENMASAFEWVKSNVNANYGGTEMFNVINEGYTRLLTTRREGQKYQDMILFMTDGDVWGQQPTQITELIRKHSDTVSCFTMGIGNGHSAELVENIARAGNGYCSHVYFSEDVPEQVQMTMRCLTSAHLRNAHLEWNDCEVEMTSTRPTSLLFENEPCYVWAKVNSVGENPSMTLKTNWRGEDKTVTTISLKDLPQSGFPLDQSFAMTQLKEWLNAPVAKMSKTEKNDKITPLAIKFNVITPYTAAVGITQSDQPNPSSSVLKRIEIPIATPQRGQPAQHESYGGMMGSRGGGGGLMQCCAMSMDCLDDEEDDGDEMDFDMDEVLCLNDQGSSVNLSNTSNIKRKLKSGKHGAAKSINISAAGSSHYRFESTATGVNTVGSSLRNPNLQLRSEAPAAASASAPWSQPPAQPKKTDLAVMEDLIKLQSLKGNWDQASLVSAGLDWVLPVAVSVPDDEVSTFRVVAFFHRLMQHSSRWNTAYKKALQWLTASSESNMALDQTLFLQMAGQMTRGTTQVTSVSTSSAPTSTCQTS